MRFKGLDLNLVVALDILLQERSVSRAAERLKLSQPAVSAALARLREYFADDLLVSIGRSMIPTAYAESLWPIARGLLARQHHQGCRPVDADRHGNAACPTRSPSGTRASASTAELTDARPSTSFRPRT